MFIPSFRRANRSSGRNIRRWGVNIAVCLAFTSCDKARELIQMKPAAAPGPVVTAVEGAPGGEMDPELAAQVQKNEEGVCFRKDLPFPTTLSVHTDELVTWANARKIGKSELGMENETFSGSYRSGILWKLEKGVATLRIEKTGPVIPPTPASAPASDAPAVKPPPELDGLTPLLGKSTRLQRTSSGWVRAGSGKENDFQEIVWARSLAPLAGDLFATVGLTPRPRWFSSTRYWKPGDSVELTGESLLLLFSGKPSGKLVMTFEDTESIGGHPVGRFSIAGKVDILNSPSPDGEAALVNLSISTGKVWCSLLHPFVLREEYEAVKAITRGSAGGPSTKVQGTATVVRSNNWVKDPADSGKEK
jgi:hypothetical protein